MVHYDWKTQLGRVEEKVPALKQFGHPHSVNGPVYYVTMKPSQAESCCVVVTEGDIILGLGSRP